MGFFFDFFSILKIFNKMSVFPLGLLNIRFNSGANNNEQLILFFEDGEIEFKTLKLRRTAGKNAHANSILGRFLTFLTFFTCLINTVCSSY